MRFSRFGRRHNLETVFYKKRIYNAWVLRRRGLLALSRHNFIETALKAQIDSQKVLKINRFVVDLR